MTSLLFKPAQRIRTQNEIDFLRHKGGRRVVPPFVVFLKPNNLGCARLLMTLTRKTGNSVLRNRVRRKLRELFRTELQLLGNYDWGFLSSRDLSKMNAGDWVRLREDLVRLVKK